MTLTLELTSPPARKPGEASRHTFNEEGGTIGRAPTNAWVLPHSEVSGQHAVISCLSGVFYIQDTSRNGIAVNSRDNRLVKDRPYALKAGDRIFIDPYIVGVMIDGGANRAVPRQPAADPFAQDDPFASFPSAPMDTSLLGSPSEGDVVDPLSFFEPLSKPVPLRKPEPVAPQVDSFLGAHYQPPPPLPGPEPMPPAPSDSGAIPPGYDPLAPDDSFVAAAPPVGQRPVLDQVPARPTAREDPSSTHNPTPPKQVVGPPEPAVIQEPAGPLPPSAPAVPPFPPAVGSPAPRAAEPAGREDRTDRAFADMLAAAGLPGVAVTPELIRNFGEILRVVVSGLMDILQARQRIKEEFRMRLTTFRPADNNPLKFSANVDDALHNLLVKRNPAYLGPVDAFADAFEDLRNHQLAMLAGMRVAFETMLAESEPDQLQEEFDHLLATNNKGALALVPAKLRYWDLYRARRRDMAKDPEATFTRLFGEEFARAYDEQFRRLKAERRRELAERSAGQPPPLK